MNFASVYKNITKTPLQIEKEKVAEASKELEKEPALLVNTEALNHWNNSNLTKELLSQLEGEVSSLLETSLAQSHDTTINPEVFRHKLMKADTLRKVIVYARTRIKTS